MVHIEIDRVSHSYGEGPLARRVLRDLDVDLDQSQIGVIGHNLQSLDVFFIRFSVQLQLLHNTNMSIYLIQISDNLIPQNTV